MLDSRLTIALPPDQTVSEPVDDLPVTALEAVHGQILECLPAGHRMARAMLGSGELADDCLQDACLLALKRHGQRDGAAPFIAWFLTIVHHRAVSMGRRQRRRGGRERTMAGCEVVDAAPEPGERAEAQELIGLAIAQMRPQHAQVLLLRHGQGQSFAEIAATLGVAQRTARTWSSRGMRSLERWLGRRRSELGSASLLMVLLEQGRQPPPAALRNRVLEVLSRAPLERPPVPGSLLRSGWLAGGVVSAILGTGLLLGLLASGVPGRGPASATAEGSSPAPLPMSILEQRVSITGGAADLRMAMYPLLHRLRGIQHLEWVEDTNPRSVGGSGAASARPRLSYTTVRQARVADVLTQWAAVDGSRWSLQGDRIVFVRQSTVAGGPDGLQQLRAQILEALQGPGDARLAIAALDASPLESAVHLLQREHGDEPWPLACALAGDPAIVHAITTTLARGGTQRRMTLALTLAWLLHVPVDWPSQVPGLETQLTATWDPQGTKSGVRPQDAQALVSCLRGVAVAQRWRWEALILELERNHEYSLAWQVASHGATTPGEVLRVLSALSLAGSENAAAALSWEVWLDPARGTAEAWRIASRPAPVAPPSPSSVSHMEQSPDATLVTTAAQLLACSPVPPDPQLLMRSTPALLASCCDLERVATVIQERGGSAAFGAWFDQLLAAHAPWDRISSIRGGDAAFSAQLERLLSTQPEAGLPTLMELLQISDDPSAREALNHWWTHRQGATVSWACVRQMLADGQDQDWASVAELITHASDAQLLQVLRQIRPAYLPADPACVSWAMALAQDPSHDPQVREAVISALPLYRLDPPHDPVPIPAAQACLRQLVADREQPRWCGAALLRLQDATLAAGCVSDPNPFVRAAACDVLERSQATPATVAALVAGLPQEPDPELLWRRLCALWGKPIPDARVLIPYLANDDLIVRRAAAVAISDPFHGPPPPAVLAALRARLAVETDADTRQVLQQALGDGFSYISTPAPRWSESGGVLPTPPAQALSNG